MTNLLSETLIILTEHNKKPEDVRWVGVNHTKPWSKENGWAIGSWEEFVRLANFVYDSSYGGNEIKLGLVVVGDDWWLERHEYDGSEWWEFKTLPVRPVAARPLTVDDIKEG